MPIQLWIPDGNPWWMSSNIIVRGSLNQADPAIEPRKDRNNYIFVRVENRGDVDAAPNCPCAKIGSFVSARVVEPKTGNDISNATFLTRIEGVSPSGKTNVVIIKYPGSGAIDVELREASTNRRLYSFGAIQPGVTVGWGFSPNGQVFLFASSASGNASLVMAEGPEAGRKKVEFFFGLNGTTAGWGFSPDGQTFLAATNNYVHLYDIESGKNLLSSPTFQWGQFHFSPCGDLFALIGKQTYDSISLYKLPAFYQTFSQWTPTVNNVSVGSLQVDLRQGNPAFQVIGSGVNGIKLTGMSRSSIDNPLCLKQPEAVQVDVWITDPKGNCTRNGSTRVGSAFANIPKKSSKEILITSPWRPDKTGHKCIVAEAYTTDARDPHPGKLNDFLVQSRRQVAQRNVIVIKPNSPTFLFPFVVQNSTLQPYPVRIELQRVHHHELLGQQDSLLEALPEASFESTRFGLLPYNCGQEISDELVQELALKLQPGELVNLALFFDNPLAPDEPAAQAFHIREFHDTGLVGGITVIGVNQQEPLVGKTPEAPTNLSPIELSDKVFMTMEDLDLTGSQPVFYNFIQGQYLTASFTNPTQNDLKNATIYLEGLSDPDVTIEPQTYFVDAFRAGDTILARWVVDFSKTPADDYTVSFVVEDSDHQYKRILTHLSVLASVKNGNRSPG